MLVAGGGILRAVRFPFVLGGEPEAPDAHQMEGEGVVGGREGARYPTMRAPTIGGREREVPRNWKRWERGTPIIERAPQFEARVGSEVPRGDEWDGAEALGPVTRASLGGGQLC